MIDINLKVFKFKSYLYWDGNGVYENNEECYVIVYYDVYDEYDGEEWEEFEFLFEVVCVGEIYKVFIF